VQKLKREIAALKEELAMATGEQRSDELSQEDLERWLPDMLWSYVVTFYE